MKPKQSGWLCERCGHESKTNEEYKTHKVDHMQGRISDKKFDRETGTMEEKPAPKKAKFEIPKPSLSAAQIDKDKTKPIKLKYVYEGNCKCGAKAMTLEVDIGKVHFVVAHCSKCSKQITQRKVTKL